MAEARPFRVLVAGSVVEAEHAADPSAALARVLVRLFGTEHVVGFCGRQRGLCLAARCVVRTGPGQTQRFAATVTPAPVDAPPVPLRRGPTMRDVRARIVEDFDGLTSIAA